MKLKPLKWQFNPQSNRWIGYINRFTIIALVFVTERGFEGFVSGQDREPWRQMFKTVEEAQEMCEEVHELFTMDTYFE